LLLHGFDHYVVPEAQGPGIAGNALKRAGMHISEDHFIAEIVHPGTGETAAHGEEGELVLTSITREAFPLLLRFRTGDMTRLLLSVVHVEGPWPDGSPSERADDIVVVNGYQCRFPE